MRPLAISLAFSAGLLLGSTARAQAPREIYERAVAHMQREEWHEASRLLQQLVAEVPGNARLHNTLAIALSSGGQGDAAAGQFRRALELDPEYPSALKNLALHELSRGRTNAAKPYLERLLETAAEEPFAHAGLAQIAHDKGDFEAAVQHFERSQRLLAGNPPMLVKFARSLLETDRRSKARLALAKISAEAQPEIQYETGLLLARLGEFSSAAQAFERARGGAVDRYELGFNLALAYRRSSQPQEAARVAEELAQSGYEQAELQNLLARAYEEAGEIKRAYDALRRATEIDPTDEANYIDLIALCLDHENFDLGVEIADIAVGRLPDSPALHVQRGVALAMKGRFEDSETSLRLAATLAPSNRLPAVSLGLILMQQDRLPEAIEVLRRHRDRGDGDYLVPWFLAEALQRSGVEPGTDAEREAVESLRVSIERNPDLFQSRLLMGKMLARRGDYSTAISHLNRARELDPEDVAATYQLAIVHRSQGNTARAKELFDLVGERKTDERSQFTKGGLLRIIREGAP